MGDQVLVRHASLDRYLAPIPAWPAGARFSTDGGSRQLRPCPRSPSGALGWGQFQRPGASQQLPGDPTGTWTALSTAMSRRRCRPLPSSHWLLNRARRASPGRLAATATWRRSTPARVSFTASTLGTTKMSCAPEIMDQEAAFLTAVQAARRYAYQDGRLILSDADGQPALVFAAPK